MLVWFGRPAMPEQVKTMEKYMCSRFFIDFPDLSQQHNKLVKFLDNHFQGKFLGFFGGVVKCSSWQKQAVLEF
jgi:hypothetical protein